MSTINYTLVYIYDIYAGNTPIKYLCIHSFTLNINIPSKISNTYFYEFRYPNKFTSTPCKKYYEAAHNAQW